MAPKRKAIAGKSGGSKAKKTKEESYSEDEVDDVDDVDDVVEDDVDDESDEEPKKSKAKPKGRGSKKAPNKKTTTKEQAQNSSLNNINFEMEAKSSRGNNWNLKITSWNVNGLRAWLQKDGMEYVKRENPDIFCVMETKVSKEKIPGDATCDGYTNYWLSGDAEGYSGVGIYTKTKPLDVTYGIDIEKHDKEGRVITAEYEDFYLVAVYVPNAGRKLVRLDYRQDWDKDFREYLKKLDAKKPVILCGDLNVAHEEIDIANPKNNKKNAGFTKEEREAFTELLNSGFVDTFRHLHPDEKGAYTFWTYMMNARGKNVGWRLDYFTISETLVPHLCESVIRKDVLGSDHCPITLFMEF